MDRAITVVELNYVILICSSTLFILFLASSANKLRQQFRLYIIIIKMNDRSTI